jgi:hypothetical protein
MFRSVGALAFPVSPSFSMASRRSSGSVSFVASSPRRSAPPQMNSELMMALRTWTSFSCWIELPQLLAAA